MSIWLPVLLAVVSAALSLLVMGPPVAALCLAMLLGLLLYLQTFRLKLPAIESFLPLYLGAVAWQLLHFIEEFATGFQRELPALLGAAPWSDTRFLAFNMVHYALFLLGGAAILTRTLPLTCFAAIFVVVSLANGIGHPALALWAGGYFPGLWTGMVSLLWGALLLRRLR